MQTFSFKVPKIIQDVDFLKQNSNLKVELYSIFMQCEENKDIIECQGQVAIMYNDILNIKDYRTEYIIHLQLNAENNGRMFKCTPNSIIKDGESETYWTVKSYALEDAYANFNFALTGQIMKSNKLQDNPDVTAFVFNDFLNGSYICFYTKRVSDLLAESMVSHFKRKTS